MQENYDYPLDYSWSKDELVTVIALWNAVEKAYEGGIAVADFTNAYQAFKKVVPSIGEEKRLGNQFEKESGYSLYKTVKKSRETTSKLLKMEAK